MNSKIQDTLQQSGLRQSGIGNKQPLSRKQTNQSSLNGKNSKQGATSTSKNIDVSKIEDKKYRDEEQKKRAMKKNRPFAIKNFEIIIDLLKFRKSSIEKAYIQVSFAFICILISNIRNYRDLVDLHYTINQGNLGTVISVLSYIEITTILKLNTTLYHVLFFLSGAFAILTPTLYFICFFMHSSDQNIKVRKFFYGRWFVNAGEYFMWILLQPIYLTFMSYLACYTPIQDSLNLVCDSSDTLYTIKVSIAVIGMVFGFFTIWFLSIFFFNGGFSTKKDSLACDNTIHIFIFNVYRILFSILICLRKNQYYYFVIYLAFNLLFSGYLSYQFFLNQGLLTFRNKYIRNLFKFLMIIIFSQNIAFSVDEFQRNVNMIGDTSSENSGQYTAIFSFIVFYFFRKMSNSQEQKMIVGNDMKNISYTEFKKRTYYLQHLLETSSDSIFQDIYFKGIISQHINTPCFHQDIHHQKCFCAMKFLHDSKKNKDVNIDRCYFSTNRNVFGKFIIKSWYQQYLTLNPTNFTAIIDYSEFIFNKMRNSCLSLANVIFLKKKYIYPVDQFRLFRLIHQIHKVNRKKNISSYKGSLNVENVIPIELKIDRIKYKIKQILNQNITFWNMLLKSIINLEELNQAIKRVFEEIDEIKRMWIRVVVYLNYRKKWRFYYAWYYLYILNQKVLISLLEKFSGALINENEIFIEEYQTDQVEDDVGSVMSNTKDDQDKINIKKIEMAFDRRSCVFKVASDNLGKIIKVNKPVLTTFGFNRYELENHVYITDLMPKSFAIQHPKYTANYIATGKSKVLYSQKKIFCVMKKGNVFAAWKFLKLYVNLQGETEFVSLIRPILNPAGSKINYIIFNDDWEVDAMTQQMYEYFMIDAELYRQQMIQLANMKHKKDKNNENGQIGKAENKIAITNILSNGMVLNLLLIIPKLIKFTKLFQFLTADDQQHFGIIPRKDKLGDIATFFKNKNIQEGGGAPPAVSMQKLKLMAQKKKSLAQQTLATKKAQEEEAKLQNGDDTTKNKKAQQQKYTITHAKSDDFDKKQIPPAALSPEDATEGKLYNTPQKGEAPIGINLTLNQDDSIGQLLGLKSKNKDKFEETTAPSPKSINHLKNLFSHQVSNVSMGSRQSSIQEFQEQIHGDEKQNEQIRKQMEKVPFVHRRKTLHQIENQEGSDDENDKTNKGDDESSQDDDDLESDYVQDNYDADGKKLVDERMEKGEQLRFIARVPYNINQLMQSYYTMSQSRLKRFDNPEKNVPKQNDNQSKNEISNKIKTFTHNSNLTYKESNTNLSFRKHETQTERIRELKEEQDQQYQRDKAFYQLVKDAYTLHVKRKKTRQFKLICTTKFKKVGTRKVGIMKIQNLEEIKYHKMLLLQQVQKNNKEFEKSNLSLSKQLSGLKDGSDPNAINSNLKAVASNLEVPTSNQQQKFSFNRNAFLANLRNTLAPLSSNVSGGNNSFQEFSQENPDSKLHGNDNETKENGMGYQLDNFEDHKKDEAIKDIQKDFEKKQGSVTFSLNSIDNIFIKEDIHQPKQQLDSIFQLQLFTRLVFFFILLFNIFTYFLGVNTYFTTIKSQSERVSLIKELNLKILDGYDNILDQVMLNNGDYTDDSLSKTIYLSKQGMQSDISETFFNITLYFQNIMVDSNFQETLFDSGTDEENTASALIISNTPAKGSYQFDVFDMFQEYIYHINELNNTMISPTQSSSISKTTINVDFVRQ